MFNESSIIVKIWTNAVIKGEKQLEEVPNVSNLVEVVTNLVEGGEIIV